MTLGVIGIVLSLICLITAAYWGMPVIIAAPLAATIALLFSGVPLLPAYTEIFMPGAAGFIINYFPLFLTGAIFGQLMKSSGYAASVAGTITKLIGSKRAILGTVLTTALLTYGGVSVYVVVFVMFPLALELFRAADIPRRLIPAAIALGAFTFIMTAIPGSPQIQNIIPGQFLGTNSFAAPILGVSSGVLIFSLGMLYLEWRKRRLIDAGESFSSKTALERNGARPIDSDNTSPDDLQDEVGVAPDATSQAAPAHIAQSVTQIKDGVRPTSSLSKIVPFLPILLVFAVNLTATYLIFPRMDWGFLSEEKFGGIELSDRISVWSVLVALIAAIIAIALLNITRLKSLGQAFAQGSRDSLMPVFNTSSEVGYGTVIGALAAFAVVREAVTGMTTNALFNSTAAISVLAGITGSASGGMTIALNAMGEDITTQVADQGVPMELLHRLIAMGSGGLDTMPHNGAVISLLIICGLTHKESYKDIFVVTLAITVAVTLLMLGVVTIFY